MLKDINMDTNHSDSLPVHSPRIRSFSMGSSEEPQAPPRRKHKLRNLDTTTVLDRPPTPHNHKHSHSRTLSPTKFNTSYDYTNDTSPTADKQNLFRSYSFGANGTAKPPDLAEAAAVWERISKSVERLPVEPATNTGSATNLSRSFSFEESVNVMRLQEQFRDSQRKLDRERSMRTTLESKKGSLEQERLDLTQ